MNHIATLVSLAGLGLSLLAAAVQAHGITLRTMAQESLPPKWLNRDGQADGVCPDILRAIEKLQPRLHFTGMDDFRSVPAIEQGLENGDVACACGLLDTPRRRRIADISKQPLYTVRHRLAVSASDRIVINTLEELVKLKQAVTTSRGAGYAEQLRARGVMVDDSSGDNIVNLKKIMAGHGRLFYMNELTLHWILRDSGLRDRIRLLPAVMREEPVYFWTSKKTDPAVALQLRQALQQLAGSGELARIYARWASER